MSTQRAISLATSAFLAGLVVLLIGLWMSGATFDSSAPILCDDEVMGPGDACISTNASRSGSYEELLQRKRESAEAAAENGPVVAAVGGVLLVGSALVLLVRLAGRDPNERQAQAASSWWSEEGPS